jgi:hypothetical protein
MPDVTIGADALADKLGPAARVVAMYERTHALMKAPQDEETYRAWRACYADEATYTAPFDGWGPSTVSVVDRIEPTRANVPDVMSFIRWVRNLDDHTAVAQVEVTGRYPDGEPYYGEILCKYTFGDDGRLKSASSYYQHPGPLAKAHNAFHGTELRNG